MRFFPNPKKIKNKLVDEFKQGSILDLSRRPKDSFADLTQFPWPIDDNAYDLIICQHVLEHLPDTVRTLEEFNRITKPNGKIFIETPHYTWFETYRHIGHCHRFSVGSFDFFQKGNPMYRTDFHITDKHIFFDDITYLLGIGFLANFFPKQYEKRLAFIFPATSFHVTFRVDK